MKKNQKNNPRKTAFTLIEMSIVILIASILITGLLSASVSSINNSNIKITNDRAKEIYKALGNFVAVKRRLPCPASIITAKSSTDGSYGTEVRSSGSGSSICVGATPVGVYKSSVTPKIVYGMVPVKALGLSTEMAEDGFGNKFAYIINQDFAGDYMPSGSLSFITESFSVGSYNAIDNQNNNLAGGVLTVKEKRGGSVITVNNGYAIMALVSYGSNKLGALGANSTTASTRSTDSEEMENDVNFGGVYNSTSAAFDSVLFTVSDSSDVFDDIVFFKTAQDFVEDFNLMFLIPCKDAGSANGFSNKNAYYGQTVYGSSCSSPADARGSYAKKCEAYGHWVDVNSCS